MAGITSVDRMKGLRWSLDRFERWFSLVANAGVLIGIYMVAAQLNLSTRALEIQNGVASSAVANAAEVAFMGESTHEAYATALFEPSQLTTAQIQQVWAYLNVGVNSSATVWSAYKAELVSEESWIGAKQSAASYINFRVGRIWWDETKNLFYPPEFVREIDVELAEYDPADIENISSKILKRIRELPTVEH